MYKIRYRQEMMGDHNALLLGCRLLAARTGEEDLAAGLAALSQQVQIPSVRELLAQITEVASGYGLQPRISRPATAQLFDVAVQLPLLAELHDRRTLSVKTLHRDPTGVVSALTIQIPALGESVLPERMARNKFLLQWNGTTLRFVRINTALICFAFFACITLILFQSDFEKFAICTNLPRSHFPSRIG